MKKISLILFAFVAFISAQAQQWVSTSPANKVAILEEFTGRNCTWCPDGHKISDQLKKDNPGKFYAINIHAGSFAPTTAPNYTTTVGTTIDAASGVTGYPAGTVNRNSSPWASSRTAWTGNVATVIGQSSPVNVFVKSSVDYNTRVLTTEVEVYYTANGTGTSNKLTVALLQNGILGPQTGMDKYPAKIVGTQYQHDHMLRMHLTPGTWGEAITDITTGKFTKKTYNTVLPANINGVPLDIYSLEIVAFVSEANNNILSGHGTEVTHNNPNLIDLDLKDSSILPVRAFLDSNTKWCDNKVTPRCVVTNKSTTVTATAFTVTATVNGVATPKTFTGSLAPGKTTVLAWNEIQVNASGVFEFKMEGFTNINGGTTITDNKTGNNSYSTNLIGIKPNAFTNLNVDMETTPFSNAFIDASENNAYALVNSTAGLGAEASKSALRLSLYSSWQKNGLGCHLVMGEANMVGVTNPTLSYYYAFSNTGEESSSAPSVKVSYSKDCGTNWIDVDTKVCVKTGDAPAGQWYIPTSAQYQKVDVNLSALVGKKCLVRVTGIPGNGGNALYIDQISIKSSCGGSTYTTSACGSYYWPAKNKTYTTSNNTDTVKLINVAGCGDSIVTLNLTIKNSTSSTFTTSACDSYYWPAKNKTYTTSNNTDTVKLINAAGCDSIVTLNLTIKNATSSTFTTSACGSYYWPAKNKTYTTSNNTDTVKLINVAGCDSIVTLNLTIKNSTSSTFTISACGSYYWPAKNKTYTTSNNTDTVKLINAAGCDSIVTLNLTIYPNPIPTIIKTGNVLSTQSYNSYQWLLNGVNIIGATTQSYTVAVSGNYQVAVTDTNNCSGVSSIGAVIVSAVNDLKGQQLKIYPNPAKDHITIDYGVFGRMNGYTLKIVNTLGQIVFSTPINQQTSYINLSTWTGKGMYYVQIYDASNTLTENRKIVLQ